MKICNSRKETCTIDQFGIPLLRLWSKIVLKHWTHTNSLYCSDFNSLDKKQITKTLEHETIIQTIQIKSVIHIKSNS